MFTINPSSFELITHGTTDAQYPTGCLRYQSVKHLIKAAWPREDLHPVYRTIGTIAEEYVAAELQAEFVDREVEIIEPVGDEVFISGRVDFKLPEEIHEVKATVSSSKRTMWRKGKVAPGHLGQLLSYMWLLELPVGKLRMFYVHFLRKQARLRLEPYTYATTLTEEHEANVKAYYRAVKAAMVEPALPPRPHTLNPCMTCPFRAVCNMDPQDKDTFVRHVNEVLKLPRPVIVTRYGEPKIKMHDVQGETNE